jgi:hypothetical protein
MHAPQVRASSRPRPINAQESISGGYLGPFGIIRLR